MKGRRTWGRVCPKLVVAGVVTLSGGAFGQADPLAVPARQWAEDASANELKVLHYDHGYLRYRMHIVDAKGDMVREVIESKDGPVARLMLKGGRTLTADEGKNERERLQEMLSSPDAYARHVKNEQNGKKQAADMMRVLPRAMIYHYAPGQPQREHHRAGEGLEVVIDFAPDPGWTPPTLMSEALTGLEGRVWIDPSSHYMTRIEVRVFRSVNFGLGLVAHIYPGGTASFEQERVSNDRWIFSHFVEHVTVRALMLKTFKEDAEVQGSDFTPVAAMGYQDAIRMLLATPVPAH